MSGKETEHQAKKISPKLVDLLTDQQERDLAETIGDSLTEVGLPATDQLIDRVYTEIKKKHLPAKLPASS